MIRGLIKIISLIVTFIILALYFVALSATVVSPDKWIIPSFLGMAMPLLWLLVIAAIIFWACNRKWLITAVMTVIIAVTFPSWRNTVVVPVSGEDCDTCKELKVMTYNIHLFNEYKNYDDVCKLIEEENPDILCLQEFGFYNRKSKDRVTERELLRRFDKIFPYRHIWYKNQKGTSSNGLATLSKYPIVNKKKIIYDSNFNISIYSDIVVDEDTIRVINNHLESNRLTSTQRNWALQLINDEVETDDFISSTKSVSMTLKDGIVKRARQAAIVGQEVDKSPYKVVVCGDLNDVSQSYTYSQIKRHLNDAYAMAGGVGYGWTYHENVMYFHIDHIFSDTIFKIKDAAIIKKEYSDHYSVKATLLLP